MGISDQPSYSGVDLPLLLDLPAVMYTKWDVCPFGLGVTGEYDITNYGGFLGSWLGNVHVSQPHLDYNREVMIGFLIFE